MKEEFFVYYQPKMNVVTETISGAEALIRQRRSDGSVVSPNEFIPLYEANGLIGELDEYVFRHVCHYQRERMDQKKKIFPISVNLSRVSMMDEQIADRYSRIIRENQIPFSSVPIEITESAAVSSQQIGDSANRMIQSGFELHMDDFGAGYSSLMSLNNIPFSVIKIDKQLIDKVNQIKGKVVVEQIINLAHLLEMDVVAEGVESREQIEILKEMDCCEIQGYYCARTMAEMALEQFVDICCRD